MVLQLPSARLSAAIAPDVLDSAPDAMIVVDSSGTIVFANRQVSALFGYAEAEVVGLSLEQLLPERFRGGHLAHRRRYEQHARVRPMGSGLELWALRRDGSEFPVEISLSPIRTEAGDLVAAAIRDATERRQAQTELQQAREAAERANQAKSRFLATASHDLRQPLQTLALLNGALRRSTRDPSLSGPLAQQEQAIEAMARLLNALLDISKLESGAIRPEVSDFTVSAIFAQLRSEFADLAERKGLELRLEPCNDRVHSDPSLLTQVLRNLLSNAIKYTRRGWVLLRCLHETGGVRLEVLDTGIGIPAAELRHIFDEFYQVGVPTNSTRDGYGLGLSIVRRIAELLGAPLDVRSQPGSGSTFSVLVPPAAAAAEPAGRRAATPSPSTTPQQNCKVLLIEDDPAVRDATRMLLKVAGFAALAAASVSEALALAAQHPDIAVMIADYHLAGGATGIEAIDAVRQSLGRPLQAILVTGDTSSAVRGVAVDAHLRIASKPINADELLAMLQEFRGS